MSGPTRRRMHDDIVDQPASLAAALAWHRSGGRAALDAAAAVLGSGRPVVLTGSGASLIACLPLHYHLAAAGRPAWLVETGELLHHMLPACRGAVVVAVSRSGESVETRQLLDALPADATVIGVTAELAGTLARRSAIPVLLAGGTDRLIAVQSYTATLLALGLLGGGNAEEATACIALLAPAIAALAEASHSWRRFLDAPVTYLLARGPALAAAQGGALLLHETARQPAVVMSGAQFRHGPVEVVSPGFRAIVIVGAASESLDQALADDIQAIGGQTRMIHHEADWSIPAAPAWLAPLGQILPLQIAALRLAEWRDIEPGTFQFAGAVTTAETGFRTPSGASE